MKKLLMCLFLSISFVLLSYADTIKLKDGTTVTGKVIGSNDSTVMLQNAEGIIVNIPKNNIQESSVTNTIKTNTAASAKTARDEYDFDEEARNLIYIGGGTVLISGGSLGSFGGGYEYLINPNFSAGITFAIWPGPAGVMAIYDVSIFLHVIGKKTFDPFIGIGLASASASYSKVTMIDLPLTVGLNFWFNRNFALRLQDKLYLLSLGYGLNEINAQLVFSF
jgi:hypothetical protein